jgi:hypothetical protein
MESFRQILLEMKNYEANYVDRNVFGVHDCAKCTLAGDHVWGHCGKFLSSLDNFFQTLNFLKYFIFHL